MCREFELVGVAEAAELLNAKKSTFVVRVMKREGFPAPVAHLRCGPIWLKDEIVAWAATQASGEGRESKAVADLDF